MLWISSAKYTLSKTILAKQPCQNLPLKSGEQKAELWGRDVLWPQWRERGQCDNYTSARPPSPLPLFKTPSKEEEEEEEDGSDGTWVRSGLHSAAFPILVTLIV